MIGGHAPQPPSPLLNSSRVLWWYTQHFIILHRDICSPFFKDKIVKKKRTLWWRGCFCAIKADRDTAIETDGLVSGTAANSSTKVSGSLVAVRELIWGVAAGGEGRVGDSNVFAWVPGLCTKVCCGVARRWRYHQLVVAEDWIIVGFCVQVKSIWAAFLWVQGTYYLLNGERGFFLQRGCWYCMYFWTKYFHQSLYIILLTEFISDLQVMVISCHFYCTIF
jgi:hypothetical protein